MVSPPKLEYICLTSLLNLIEKELTCYKYLKNVHVFIK